jgi:hypothetical protein
MTILQGFFSPENGLHHVWWGCFWNRGGLLYTAWLKQRPDKHHIHCPCLIDIWFDLTVGEVCLWALKLSWLQFCKVFLSPNWLAWSGRWIFLTLTLEFLFRLLKCSQPERAKCSLIFSVSGWTWGNHIKPFSLWLCDGWEVNWYLPYDLGILVW